MKRIPLSRNLSALVDDDDFEELSKYKWYASHNRKYYARRHQMKNGKKSKVYMHRQIMGVKDPNVFVDHIDGNGLNNQRANLRLASHSQNLANVKKRKGTSSKYRGVNFVKKNKNWQAQIQHKGKLYFLGIYQSEAEAAKAYDKKAKELFGEYAQLNFKNEVA